MTPFTPPKSTPAPYPSGKNASLLAPRAVPLAALCRRDSSPPARSPRRRRPLLYCYPALPSPQNHSVGTPELGCRAASCASVAFFAAPWSSFSTLPVRFRVIVFFFVTTWRYQRTKSPCRLSRRADRRFFVFFLICTTSVGTRAAAAWLGRVASGRGRSLLWREQDGAPFSWTGFPSTDPLLVDGHPVLSQPGPFLSYHSAVLHLC